MFSRSKNFIKRMGVNFVGHIYSLFLKIRDIPYITTEERKHFHAKVLYETTPETDKICILILFQKNGIPRHVQTQMMWIKKLGYSIHVVSNTPLRRRDVNILENFSFKISKRKNYGYDFGGYKYGVCDFLDKYAQTSSRLMIMNDSIFFPLHDPRPLYEKVDGRDNDFWGWSENWEFNHHISSYGIVFKKPCFTSRPFETFWRKYRSYSDRLHAIHKGEIQLTTEMKAAGFVSDVAIRSSDFAKEVMKYNNKKDLMDIVFEISDAKRAVVDFIDGSRKLNVGELKTIIIDSFEEASVVHTHAVVLNKRMNFPIIKKDIIYKGIFRSVGFFITSITSESECVPLDEVESFYRMRGKVLTKKGDIFKKILVATGRH